MNFMKKIFLSVLLLLSFWSTYADCDKIFNDCSETIPYCGSEWIQCSLTKWIELLKWKIIWIESERPFSLYAQDIVVFLLWFITLVSVIYIIYAWFNILIWGWNEDKLKKSKNTIIYVIVWIITIWLANSIVMFVINILYVGNK